jgi:hypothetical protein
LTDASAIFRRVGWVLIAVGVLDIAILAVCLWRGITYPSGFNIFAVWAGVLLLRGSLASAALVRWTAAFTLASTVALLAAAAVLFPRDLISTCVRLYPAWSAAALGITVGLLALFAWLQYELERPPVVDALAAAGKRWSLVGALALGAGMTVLVGGLFALLLRGDLATQAVARAQAQTGSGYRYQVLMLIATYERGSLGIQGSVVAWNGREVRIVPVRWADSL